MSRHDHRHTREWVRSGTEMFLQRLDRIPDNEFHAPSRLPGWSLAHVAAHVARNAEALGRLAMWARTGVETPMYRDAAQRQEEIGRSAGQSPAELRRDVRATAQALDEELMSLDAAAWAAQVRSAKGRIIPAAEVPWMRAREVWVHAIDLDTGGPAVSPPVDFVDCLLDECTDGFAAREDAPALVLTATDRDRTWTVSRPRATSVTVSGTAAALMTWLVGRGDAEGVSALDGHLPALPAWL